jgi:hypothetical protein
LCLTGFTHMYSVPGLELMLAFQSCSVAATFLTRALAAIIFSLVEVDLWPQLMAMYTLSDDGSMDQDVKVKRAIFIDGCHDLLEEFGSKASHTLQCQLLWEQHLELVWRLDKEAFHKLECGLKGDLETSLSDS